MKQRLDKVLVARGLAPTRSQAEHMVSLGQVLVAGQPATKSGQMVDESTDIKLTTKERYVSRAGLKLASVTHALGIDFTDKVVLDVGSSTGGFSDYALQHGARKVVAVDVGTDQLHPSLRGDERIELYEKTDIRDVYLSSDQQAGKMAQARLIDVRPDIIVIDVSFISLRQVIPHIARLADKTTDIIAMVKPQFEADRRQLTKSGIVKNDRARRDILAQFEQWSRQHFVIIGKADSEVAGTHGNRERFYNLRKTSSG